MNKYTVSAILLAVLAGCSSDEEVLPAMPARLTSEASVRYDACCQRDTIRFEAQGTWTASVDADWVTLPQSSAHSSVGGDLQSVGGDLQSVGGDLQSPTRMLPLYIQQNDDNTLRVATVTITVGGDSQSPTKLTVALSQRVAEDNSKTINPADAGLNYCVGWGYDAKADVADASGLRGQVLDGSKIGSYVRLENDASNDMRLESGFSHTELEQKIGAKVYLDANLFVASAKMEAQFSKQVSAVEDRRFVWCSDYKTVKTASISADLDLGNESSINGVVTAAFKNSVRDDSPKELVQKFGTHIITVSTLGGKLNYYFSYSRKVTTEVETVIKTVQAKVLFVKKTWTSKDEKVWSEISESFKSSYDVSGGGAIGNELRRQLEQSAKKGNEIEDNTLFDKWSNVFKTPQTANLADLAMVDFKVMPIWEIVEPISKAKAEQIENYVKKDYLAKK